MVTLGAVVGVLALPVTMSLFLLASTRHMGPTEVGFVIMRSGYFDPNRSKTPSPGNQL
jgi:hypothetical protein